MKDTPDDAARPGDLRFLRWLVIALTTVMIVGLLTIVTVLVIRLNASPAPVLPETIDLPAGMEAVAVTVSREAVVVLTQDGRVLAFDRFTGAPRGEARLEVLAPE